jgi:hypothetical protein
MDVAAGNRKQGIFNRRCTPIHADVLGNFAGDFPNWWFVLAEVR